MARDRHGPRPGIAEISRRAAGRDPQRGKSRAGETDMPANRFELLATWYLRFNGYFTTANFSVHPDFRNRPGGTDADIIAVRFPHSREYQRRFNFDRDTSLIRPARLDFLICEGKSGPCDINQNSW